MMDAASLLHATWAEVQALPAGSHTPSPCISICRVNADSGLCEGCFRTLDEIATWSVLDDFEKREVWQQLLQRAKPPEPR